MDQNNFFLEGQTAVVTGGASGIGLATVKMLSSVGANVIIADINKTNGSDIAEQFKLQGKKVDYVYCDVSSESSILTFIEEITKKKYYHSNSNAFCWDRFGKKIYKYNLE